MSDELPRFARELLSGFKLTPTQEREAWAELSPADRREWLLLYRLARRAEPRWARVVRLLGLRPSLFIAKEHPTR